MAKNISPQELMRLAEYMVGAFNIVGYSDPVATQADTTRSHTVGMMMQMILMASDIVVDDDTVNRAALEAIVQAKGKSA